MSIIVSGQEVRVGIPEIDVEKLERRLAVGAALLDVRELDEWHSAHISEAAHVPLAEVPVRAHELPEGPPLYVICAKGGRSAVAVEWLRGHGVEAVNVAGGMDEWLQRGKPAVLGGG